MSVLMYFNDRLSLKDIQEIQKQKTEGMARLFSIMKEQSEKIEDPGQRMEYLMESIQIINQMRF